tara:strand:+ start:330 stop:875 length:546 start_codon:yes stop_codon:yes gene_type:complete
MIPVSVLKISYHPESRSYAVILKEITGKKCLPVVVGSFEAQSIALAIEVVNTPRPLTHDLICDLIKGIDGNLSSVKINHLDDGVFFAQMEIHSQELGKRVIDARPSDAIAVALRLNAPILVAKEIIKKAGIGQENLVDEKKVVKNPKISLKALKQKLKNAIDEEEYEVAAKLRDKIIKLES